MLASSLDTINWRSYHNEEFGYSIRYPNDFKIEYQQTTLTIRKKSATYDPDYGGIKIDIEKNPDRLTFEDYFDGQRAPKYSIQEGQRFILPKEPGQAVYKFNPSECLCTERIIPRMNYFVIANDVDNEPLDSIVASITFDK